LWKSRQECKKRVTKRDDESKPTSTMCHEEKAETFRMIIAKDGFQWALKVQETKVCKPDAP
ncbi:MAG: hypothetical protein AAF802_33555, partial [Planctomycetota bacterium]